MQYVHDVLNEKGSKVWIAPPDMSVWDALHMMADKNIGALVVMDGESLIGIFSERDYARRLAIKGLRSRDTPVKQIMTEVIATVSPGHSVQDCMEIMTNERVRHLPVVEDEQVIGLVSIGDVVKSIISHQEHMIHQLENYIAGRV